jgi:hypothetical protein
MILRNPMGTAKRNESAGERDARAGPDKGKPRQDMVYVYADPAGSARVAFAPYFPLLMASSSSWMTP